MDLALLAIVSARAYYGRTQRSRWDAEALPDHPLGDVLMQVLLAVFLHSNPVRTHTFLKALMDTKLHGIPGVPKETLPLAFDGYNIFHQFTNNAILFQGAYRGFDHMIHWQNCSAS